MGDYNGYLTTEPGIVDLCAGALKSLSSQGLITEECQPEYDMARLWQTWLTLRHWTIASSAKSLYDNPKLRPLLKPEAVWEIEGGLQQTGLDISRASIARGDWYKALHALFERYDFLALPSAQVFPFAAQTHWPKQINDRKMDTYHRWMEIVIGGTLSGCPVLNLPVGFDQQGRPMGMQIIAPMGEDDKLLDFAEKYEAQTSFLSIRPKLRAPS
jgi:amidase